MAPHIVQFRTMSQTLEDIEAALAPVSALTDTKRLVTVSWAPVPCSQHYNVYQRSMDYRVWLQLSPSMGAMYSLQAEACSQYE